MIIKKVKIKQLLYSDFCVYCMLKLFSSYPLMRAMASSNTASVAHKLTRI